mmetsp:Transcript_13553/g.42319  ORF Transcript_13553/g.42319 Transcript_13553/m.42319 type:complete len:375 (-) Transcript_13553:1118-2242(-)
MSQAADGLLNAHGRGRVIVAFGSAVHILHGGGAGLRARSAAREVRRLLKADDELLDEALDVLLLLDKLHDVVDSAFRTALHTACRALVLGQPGDDLRQQVVDDVGAALGELLKEDAGNPRGGVVSAGCEPEGPHEEHRAGLHHVVQHEVREHQQRREPQLRGRGALGARERRAGERAVQSSSPGLDDVWVPEQEVAHGHQQRLPEGEILEQRPRAAGIRGRVLREVLSVGSGAQKAAARGVLALGEEDGEEDLQVLLAEALGHGHELAEADRAGAPEDGVLAQLRVQQAREDEGLDPVEQAPRAVEQAGLRELRKGVGLALLLPGHAHAGSLSTVVLLVLVALALALLAGLLLVLLALLRHAGVLIREAFPLQR